MDVFRQRPRETGRAVRRRGATRPAWLPRWQPVARLAIVAGLGLFATILFGAIEERDDRVDARAIDRADPEAVITSTGSELVQTARGGENYRLRSGHQLTFSDGSMRFQDGFRLEVAEQAARDSFVITGDRASVDDGESEVLVEGAVEMHVSDGLSATTETATYATEAAEVTMPGPSTLSRDGLVASGRPVVYRRDRGVVVLGGAARVELTGDDNRSAVAIRAAGATLDHDDGYMHFAGGTVIDTGPHRLSADTTAAYFGEDETVLERLELTGDARIAAATPAPTGLEEMRAGEMTLAFVSDTRTLERAVLTAGASVGLRGPGGTAGARIAADTMDVTMAADGTDVGALVADSDVRLALPDTGDGTRREIRAGILMTPIPPASGTPDDAVTGSEAAGAALTSVRFDREVRFVERSTGAREVRANRLDAGVEPGLSALLEARFLGDVHFEDERRVADADTVVYDLVANELRLTTAGDAGRRPRLVDGTNAIEAPAITVQLDGARLSATGGVQNVLAPRDQTALAEGGRTALLDDEEQVFASAESLAYDSETGVATYAGGARLWQGDTSFQGTTVLIDDRTGALEVTGKARTTIQMIRVDGATGAPVPSLARIAADGFSYDDTLRQAVYDQNVVLLSSHGDIKAGTLTVVLAADGRTLERLEATGSVKLRLADRWATGDRLVYHEADGRYEMEGAPVEIVEEVEPEAPLTPQPPPRPGAPPPRASCQSTTGRSMTFYRDVDEVLVDGRREIRTESGTGVCPPQVF